MSTRRYLCQLKIESSGELGCTSSLYTANAIVPAESGAVHLGALEGAETSGTRSGRHFFADGVGGSCMISPVEVRCA